MLRESGSKVTSKKSGLGDLETLDKESEEDKHDVGNVSFSVVVGIQGGGTIGRWSMIVEIEHLEDGVADIHHPVAVRVAAQCDRTVPSRVQAGTCGIGIAEAGIVGTVTAAESITTDRTVGGSWLTLADSIAISIRLGAEFSVAALGAVTTGTVPFRIRIGTVGIGIAETGIENAITTTNCGPVGRTVRGHGLALADSIAIASGPGAEFSRATRGIFITEGTITSWIHIGTGCVGVAATGVVHPVTAADGIPACRAIRGNGYNFACSHAVAIAVRLGAVES